MIFRNSINKYIETDEPGSGGQFWPIVKHVKVRLPNCDVCSSGAVLVDLPGVRDSNAARDKIARDVSRLHYNDMSNILFIPAKLRRLLQWRCVGGFTWCQGF